MANTGISDPTATTLLVNKLIPASPFAIVKYVAENLAAITAAGVNAQSILTAAAQSVAVRTDVLAAQTVVQAAEDNVETLHTDVVAKATQVSTDKTATETAKTTSVNASLTAVTARNEAAGFSEDAGDYAAAAQALLSGKIYASAAAGDAATPAGEAFLVQGTMGGEIYAQLFRQNGAGGANQNLALPSKALIDKFFNRGFQSGPIGERGPTPFQNYANGFTWRTTDLSPNRDFIWIKTGFTDPEGVVATTDHWFGYYTQNELNNLAIGKHNFLAQERVAGLPTALQTYDDAAVKVHISDFKAEAITIANPVKVMLNWAARGVVTGFALAWAGYSVPLGADVRSFNPPVWSEQTKAILVADSMGEGKNWETVAQELGLSLTNVAKYSSGPWQPFRLGTRKLYFTTAGGVIPASGQGVNVTHINGGVPTFEYVEGDVDYPFSGRRFLNTFPGDTINTNCAISGSLGGRHGVISVPNGGTTVYTFTPDDGLPASTIPAQSLFIPDNLARLQTDEIWIRMSQNYFYADNETYFPNNVNPRVFEDIQAIIDQSRGQRIIIVGLTPGSEFLPGTKMWNAIRYFNEQLRIRWPKYALWLPGVGNNMDYMIANGSDGSAGDEADKLNGILPRSTTSDGLHHNLKGQGLEQTAFKQYRLIQTVPPAVNLTTKFFLKAFGTNPRTNALTEHQVTSNVIVGDLAKILPTTSAEVAAGIAQITALADAATDDLEAMQQLAAELEEQTAEVSGLPTRVALVEENRLRFDVPTQSLSIPQKNNVRNNIGLTPYLDLRDYIPLNDTLPVNGSGFTQAITDALAARAELILPKRRLMLSGVIPASISGLKIIGQGPDDTIFDIVGNHYAFDLKAGSYDSTATLLTANVAAGDRVLAVASTTRLVAGQWANIQSDTAWETSYKGARYGELVRIETINSATQVTLSEPLNYSYTTAANARMNAMTLGRGVQLSGFGFLNTSPLTTTAGAMTLAYGDDIDVNHITGRGLDGPLLSVNHCAGGEVQHIRGYDMADDETNNRYGYVCNASGVTRGVRWSHLYGRKVRHVFTDNGGDGGANSPTGIPFNNQVHNSSGEMCTNAVFSNHEEADRTSFRGCNAMGSLDMGFEFRGRRTLAETCDASEMLGAMFRVQTAATDFVGRGLTGSRSYGSASARGNQTCGVYIAAPDATVDGFYFHRVSDSGIVIAANRARLRNGVIKGAGYAGVNGGGVRFSGASTDHILDTILFDGDGNGGPILGNPANAAVTGLSVTNVKGRRTSGAVTNLPGLTVTTNNAPSGLPVTTLNTPAATTATT